MILNKTIYIARGGLFTALGVIFIYLSTVSPTSKIYILGLASCIIPLSIITTNIKTGLITYICTSILSILIVGFKGNVAAYILFFGSYGVAKYYIEKLRKMPLEFAAKLLFFNATTGFIYWLYTIFFTEQLKINIPVLAAFLMLQFVFLCYDYALTLFISYINRRFAR